MYTVYFIFFHVASATATKFGLSRGLLGLQYDQINASESESESTLHVNDRSNRDAQGRINNGERINTRHHQKRHRGVMWSKLDCHFHSVFS